MSWRCRSRRRTRSPGSATRSPSSPRATPAARSSCSRNRAESGGLSWRSARKAGGWGGWRVTCGRDGSGGHEDGVPGLDTSVANPARVWNYWVGGKDNFAVDREAADEVMAVMPSMPLLAKAGRRFLVDAVHELTDQRGIRQFLDIGT